MTFSETANSQLRAIYGVGYLSNSIDKPLKDGEPMLETAIDTALQALTTAQTQYHRLHLKGISEIKSEEIIEYGLSISVANSGDSNEG